MPPTAHAPAGLLTSDLFIGGKRLPAEAGRYVDTADARAAATAAAVSAGGNGVAPDEAHG